MVLLDDFFESTVDVSRRKHGDRQALSSLINEEAMLLGKYMRKDIPNWIPRVPKI